MNNNIVTIVMTSDKNYILQSKVTLWSMLCSSNKDYFYSVNVLCSPKLDSDSRIKLKDIEKYFGNIEILFVEINEELFAGVKVHPHIPIASYYRLMMPELIQADKCLFLDGDMIINTDIAVLYNIDMGDNILAGVIDGGLRGTLEDEEHRKILNIPYMDSYINAGVLVWNLKKMREMNIVADFIEHMGKGYPVMDNDVLNKCCYGMILLLEDKYNMFSMYYNKKNIDAKNPRKEMLMAIDESDMIIHYAYWTKPWKVLRSNGATLWWDMAKKSLDERDYLDMWNEAERFARMTDWSTIAEKAAEAKDVIIFGYTEIGKTVCDSLIKRNISAIRGFSDNAEEKWLQTYKGYNVFAPDDLTERYPEALWIVTSQNYHKEIIRQLERMEIKKERIIRYLEKEKFYFAMLDNEYVEYEKREQELK